jgi:hypothetical protein
MKSIIKEDKRALSEIVSYVLLIVIALGLATGVYAWMKNYLPSEKEIKCPDDVALSIKNYNCILINKTLILQIENRGMFNVNGFYIRASNETGKIPTLMLNSNNSIVGGQKEGNLQNIPNSEGRYDFDLESPFITNSVREFNFNYSNFTKLYKLQIQPYTRGKNTLYLCNNPITIDLQGC